jgi:hypothetical protein
VLDPDHARDEAVADLPAWAGEAFTERQLAELPLRALWKLALRMFQPAGARDWPTIQHVALVLESYLGTVTLDGHPSQRRLAQDTGRKPITVRRSLEQLEAMGWLEIARGQTDRRGYPAAHRYTGTFPESLAVVQCGPPCGPRLVSADPPSKGVRRGIEGASKGHPSMGTEGDPSMGTEGDPPEEVNQPSNGGPEDSPVGTAGDPSMGTAGSSGGYRRGSSVGTEGDPEVATRSVQEKLPSEMPPTSLRSATEATEDQKLHDGNTTGQNQPDHHLDDLGRSYADHVASGRMTEDQVRQTFEKKPPADADRLTRAYLAAREGSAA